MAGRSWLLIPPLALAGPPNFLIRVARAGSLDGCSGVTAGPNLRSTFSLRFFRGAVHVPLNVQPEHPGSGVHGFRTRTLTLLFSDPGSPWRAHQTR